MLYVLEWIIRVVSEPNYDGREEYEHETMGYF